MSADEHAIEAALARVDGVRRAAWRSILLVSVVPAIAGFAGAFLLAHVSWLFCLLLGFASLAWLLVSFLGFRMESGAAFKRELLPLALARVDPGLRHEAQGVSREEFCATRLFEEPGDLQSDDGFTGHIGEVPVRFALVRATRREDKNVVVCFEGLFFVADFNKSFHGRTRVRAGGENLIDALADNHVEIEDARFAKAFSVDSTDQVEARYLLTPDFCERLLHLTERYRPVAALFEGGNITLALGMPYRALDGLPDETLDREQFERMVGKLKEVAALAEHLELDTRIWSKRGYATPP